jgi:hypothetical protein
MFERLSRAFDKPAEHLTEITPELGKQIELYFKIYSELDQGDMSLKTERFMLERFLDLNNFRIDQDTLDEAFSGQDNVFEIYSADFSQLYRSASFLRFKTYSLVRLMMQSNFELYERESDYIPLVQEQIAPVLAQRKTIKFSVPAHKVWEKLESKKINTYWNMKLGIAAPVYNWMSSGLAGFFVSHRTEQIFAAPFESRPRLELI